MKERLEVFWGFIKDLSCLVYATYSTFLWRHGRAILLFFGMILLFGGLSSFAEAKFLEGDAAIDDEILRWGVCRLFKTAEGAFGGLIATLAGVIAIIFAAIGSFRVAYASLSVAIGAFILRAFISLYFGTNFNQCAGDLGIGTAEQ